MASIFVTASDTDAGKTHVTALLVRLLKKAGRDVLALKPVSSGSGNKPVNADVEILLEAQGMRDATQINLYSFDAALAPAQAAAVEGQHIDTGALLDWCRSKAGGHELTLIEGVGGLMVPLCDDYLVSDWLDDMPDCEVLLVVRVRLGGINHALLTLDKLQLMARPPRWIIMNDADGVGEDMLDRHVQALAGRCGAAQVIRLPHGAGPAALAPLAAHL